MSTKTNHNLAVYYFNNLTLDAVSYKYIGIHVSSYLTWTVHALIGNTNRMLGYRQCNLAKAPSPLKLIQGLNSFKTRITYFSLGS